MLKQRRTLLLLLSLLPFHAIGGAEMHPLDAVPVYLVPLDDFPEELAAALAKSLQNNLSLRVKASLRLPPLPIASVAGTNQLVSDDILLLASKASSRLPEASPTTYRVFLSTRDINARSANLRFQFSAHNKALNCSVVSLARLLEYAGERPVLTERAISRTQKMIKRAIGEMYLGWKRSPNPDDIMYSPLMSLDELDKLSLDHAEEPKEKAPPPYVPRSTTNSI
jgi:predicted Zn-dependent protease